MWFPETRNVHTTKHVNFFQLLSVKSTEREPVRSTFSYLFKRTDPYYCDWYEFSDKEKELRKQYHEKIRSQFTTAEDYLAEIKKRAWIEEDMSFYLKYLTNVWKTQTVA